MQEQAISLDEADQNGNTAVHVAAQFGHLSCVQVCFVWDTVRERQEAALPPISCFCSVLRDVGLFCSLTDRKKNTGSNLSTNAFKSKAFVLKMFE